LDAAVDRCVADIVAGAPQAVRLQKRLIDSWMEAPMDGSIAASIDAFAHACALPERTERMSEHIQARQAAKSRK